MNTKKYFQKGVMATAIFAFLLISPNILEGQCAGNMVINPGFESGLTDWDINTPNLTITPDSYTGSNAAIMSGNGASFYQSFDGTIGDYIWYDYNSNGNQDEGAGFGLPYVKLTLLDGTNTEIANTNTDANGWYEFTGLAADNYTIIVDYSFLITKYPTISHTTYDYDGLY